jgi:CheY-like chemotaxis protein
MFGVTPGEHLTPGTLASQRIHRTMLSNEESSEYQELPLMKALHGEESYGQEYELRLPDNRRVTLLTSAAPIHDGKGAVVGAVCGFADITAQKALMRELELRRREAEEGAHVIEAADAASALAALDQEQPHALLLDMMLPDLDGREVLKAMREKRPHSLKAVFVLTGDLTHERLQEVQQLGADGLIGKPISVSQLVQTLSVLNRRPN